MKKIKIIAIVLAICFLLSGCSVATDFSNLMKSGKIIEDVENSA
jgi:PBP1b-binding outer membrane lipoprotein LpoB